jgi:hypothetical protein
MKIDGNRFGHPLLQKPKQIKPEELEPVESGPKQAILVHVRRGDRKTRVLILIYHRTAHR